VYENANQLKQELMKRAAIIWEIEADEVRFERGVFSHQDKKMTFAELASRLDDTGGPVVTSAAVKSSKNGPAFATHIVDVEVDPETGKVQILRYTAVQDAGKAIYPMYVESQMQGGVAQGVGWALNEEYLYDDKGRLLNASLLDYRMPVTLDLPMIETIIVEVQNPGHPYGVRGVGEVPIVPPPAALANAIYRAIGVRMNVLPMSPARIVAELQKLKG
jgi:CO/xanthine dehydrogenase Mo-binding subunit